MIDQEGGLVKRIDGAPTASARDDGRPRRRLQPPSRARAPPPTCATLGVNVDLAPVLDVARPGGTIAETERGFGSTAAEVAATAVPFAAALQEGGVAATAKHFPGLGSARLNTDFAVQRIGLSKATLRGVDEAPYRRFVDAGGEMVMLSTAIYPALSPKPAAFSPPIATGELRAGSASRASRSPTRSAASPSGLRRARQSGRGRGARRHRPAPLHRPERSARPPRALLQAAARRQPSAAPPSKTSARPRPAPAPRLAAS